MADPDEKGGHFLGRWSQRKVQARQAALPADEPGELASHAAGVAHAPAGPTPAATAAALPTDTTDKPAPPTLEDVAKLTVDSDYSAFAARHVDAKVRNAAMRKLFADDPHFNVMDGLDVYIDDYSVGVPIPKSMMRQMVQARSLGLLDDELVDQDKPPSPELPTMLPANDNKLTHENTDLQLQRDDAAGHSSVAGHAELAEEPVAARSPGHGTDAPDHQPG
jgi:hypothetical protein